MVDAVARRTVAAVSRERRLFVLAQGATLSGNWIQVVGLGVIAHDATGSVGWTAFVLSLRQLPLLVMGPITRRLGSVDRPARVGAVCQMLSALASLVLLVRDPNLGLLIAVGTVIGVLNGLDNSARLSVGIGLWDESASTSAMAMNNLISTVARLVGPLLGAAILSIGDARATIAANAGSFALAAFAFLSLDRIAPIDADGRRPLTPKQSSRRTLRTLPAIPLATLLCFVLFAMNLQAVVLVWLTDDLGFSDSSYAYALAGVGVGGLGGAILGARIARRLPPYVGLLAIGAGLCLAVLGILDSLAAILTVLVLLGLVGVLLVTGLGTRFEAETRRQGDMGPVTVFAAILTGLAPLGGQLTGFLADVGNARTPFWLGAALLLSVGGAGAIWKEPR